MKKILVADDEAAIRRLVCDFLRNAGFTPVEAVDGNDAFEKFTTESVDLAVLDIMMPGMDGWEVCRQIRKKSDIPIVMLTARSQEFDEIMAFEAGADDYVTKPFSPTILVKRIEAHIKRTEKNVSEQQDVIRVGSLVLNKAAHSVIVDGNAVDLTIKEYNILLKLSSKPDRIFSREQLLDDIWGLDYIGDPRTVDSHVARLRTKLGDWGEKNLKTVYGLGYKVEVPAV